MARKLTAGDTFPALTLNVGTDDRVNLPADIATPLAIVLFYRGHW